MFDFSQNLDFINLLVLRDNNTVFLKQMDIMNFYLIVFSRSESDDLKQEIFHNKKFI
ncbi:hypothetical protein pb186bvf_005160 [Paramecium bursaria]